MHGTTGGIRAKILGAIANDLSGGKYPWKILFLDNDARIRFIVFEHDVVPRLVFLDQRVFKQQRIEFGFYHDVLNVGNLPYQNLGLPIFVLLLVEIARNSVLQIFGFSYIEYFSGLIKILINPRLVGKQLQDVFDFFGAGLHKVQVTTRLIIPCCVTFANRL